MILSEFYAFWFDFSFIAGNFRTFELFVENFGLNWAGNGVQVGVVEPQRSSSGILFLFSFLSEEIGLNFHDWLYG
jgi:hypothetical protein